MTESLQVCPSVSIAEVECNGEHLTAVDAIVEDYLANAEQERADFKEHALRTSSLVEAFAGKLVPDCSDAILLHDVVSRFLNKNEKYTAKSQAAAAKALLAYLSDPEIPEDRRQFTRNVLSDLDNIEVAAGKHRKEMARQAEVGDSPLDDEIVEMIVNGYKGNIPAKVWKTAEPIIDCDDMRRLLNNVNLESVIIKACELVDNLRYPSSERESALLQDVLEAESFYAPICEVVGLEGLGSYLMDRAKTIRLQKQGQGELIKKAEARLADIDRAGLANVIRKALGKNKDQLTMVRVVEPDYEDRNELPVQVGEFLFAADDSSLVSGNYRLKTVGSCADKYARYEGEDPMDMVGLMVISDDEEKSRRDFGNFCEYIQQRAKNNELHLKPARGKRAAIYIQGSDHYVDTMVASLNDKDQALESSDEFETSHCVESISDNRSYMVKKQTEEDVGSNGYAIMNVAKATFVLPLEDSSEESKKINIPVEVQFLTKAERRRSRLGDIAHIAYKYIDTRIKREDYSGMSDRQKEKRQQELAAWARATRKNFVEILESIHARRSRMDPHSYETNGQSNVGGDELEQKLVDYYTESAVE